LIYWFCPPGLNDSFVLPEPSSPPGYLRSSWLHSLGG
jgi:hypothetical protein